MSGIETIEGRLATIAETWPLQLALQPEHGPPWAVTVGDGTRVGLRGAAATPAALRPGQHLRATGQQQGPLALLAQAVEIL